MLSVSTAEYIMDLGQRQICYHCTIPLLPCLCGFQLARDMSFFQWALEYPKVSISSMLAFDAAYEVSNGNNANIL